MSSLAAETFSVWTSAFILWKENLEGGVAGEPLPDSGETFPGRL